MLDNHLSSVELEQSYSSLESRVRHLEDAVAAMQDTHLVEERILDRLQERPQFKSGPAPVDDHMIAGEPPAPAHVAPAAPAPSMTAAAPPPLSGLAELRAMVRMFFDIRYHVAWTTRLLTLVLLALIMTSHWWFPPAWMPLVGVLFDKTWDILLAFVLYRVLSAEARRYVLYRHW